MKKRLQRLFLGISILIIGSPLFCMEHPQQQKASKTLKITWIPGDTGFDLEFSTHDQAKYFIYELHLALYKFGNFSNDNRMYRRY